MVMPDKLRRAVESIVAFDRIRQRQERGAVAGCDGADFVAKFIAQHHIHGGADDLPGAGIPASQGVGFLGLQCLSEGCAALSTGGNGHGGGSEWVDAG